MTLGWVANIFLLVGLWFLGKDRRWPFLLTFVGETVWLVAILTSTLVMWDMAFICVVFAMLALNNWRKWGNAKLPDKDLSGGQANIQ